MKMLVDMGHTTIESIMAEALSRKLPFERIVADRLRREQFAVDASLPPIADRVAKNKDTLKKGLEVSHRAKELAVNNIESKIKVVRSEGSLPDSFVAPPELCKTIRQRGCVMISDIYYLVDCTNAYIYKNFTLNDLYKCFPSDIFVMITPNQVRGWPAVFHAYMKSRIHVDFNPTSKPITYWRRRRDA